MDEVVVDERVENASQAEALAGGAIRESNKDKLTGSFSTDGNILLVAGANLELEGFGAFSGKWTIKESTHRISVDSGYTTEVSIRKGPYKKTFKKVSTNKESRSEVDWLKDLGLS